MDDHQEVTGDVLGLIRPTNSFKQSVALLALGQYLPIEIHGFLRCSKDGVGPSYVQAYKVAIAECDEYRRRRQQNTDIP